MAYGETMRFCPSCVLSYAPLGVGVKSKWSVPHSSFPIPLSRVVREFCPQSTG